MRKFLHDICGFCRVNQSFEKAFQREKDLLRDNSLQMTDSLGLERTR